MKTRAATYMNNIIQKFNKICHKNIKIERFPGLCPSSAKTNFLKENIMIKFGADDRH